MTTAELLEQARKLSREEQMQLAHDLWVEADGPYEDPAEVDAAWATEIGQRLQGIVDGTEAGVPHDEVMKRFGL
jgi:putative addiction module component (TIGR02574 family)